ncbi:protease HtpX [Paracoccus stylophorae]|uniref:Protease HtpX homolog n=1 Tax=Paracoccus stylophorae TaxID=659350 RepID=A0ABY7SRM0_9RHOB|nr:protease HtpX [Paracoccus stylophorae]WCR09665.1 protease HtpX [Paracoccus stylophorae]
MLRLGLYLGANLAILLVLSAAFRLLGIEGMLQANGVDLNLTALLIFAAVIGFAGSLISLFLSKPMAKAAMGVNVIARPRDATERWLLETVHAQADRAGIGRPEVGIFDHPSPNAFATGWNRDDALIAVSTGLLRHMSRGEVEAVLGHEVSHAANGDMVTLALIQGVVNTFVIFLSRLVGLLFDRLVLRIERGYGPGFWIVSLIMEMVLGVLAMAIVMWFSRWREYRADAGGAALAGRANMIAALERLKRAQDAPPLPEEMRAFAISAGRVQALFASHPPLDARIAALRAGGR